jgi:hypothetical protein
VTRWLNKIRILKEKLGTDSDLKEQNWTGSTGLFGSSGLRPKGHSPQAKKFPIILVRLSK